ncbi:MAG: diaminopimelate epimerase [Chloroflexi bacterium]|nr:diaminopimelate epimerase [Chloroflexota bacterium]
MHFTKMHGTGNDFVVVDAREIDRDWPRLAVATCHRHFGVGADGLILLLPSEIADFRMRMFNPDGSEAEICGNGIRCFARYVVERGLGRGDGRQLAVETLAGVRRVRFTMASDKSVASVQVGMGHPELRPEAIPVAIAGREDELYITDYPIRIDGRELKLTFVSMGNPHAVCFLEEAVDEFPLHIIGPKVERHPLFPRRTNFEIANVLSRESVRARVWERGAGETMACGTGACAVAVAGHLHRLTVDNVNITLPGGALAVSWDGRGEVLLSGPAEFVFEGEWPDE